jgi:hypothetical protein
MKLTSNQIKDIAGELEAGMKIFINRDTLDYRSVLDWDAMNDDAFWRDELKKIKNEWADYFVIEKLESREAFRIMESFVDGVNNERLKEDLIKILGRRSPFANFKDEVESSEYRQKWFDFRLKKYTEYVKDCLELEDIEYGE